MQFEKLGEKSQAILKALAEGSSFEQILARDPSLTYHDVFRAASESPTRHWRKKAMLKHPPKPVGRP
jgi:hypothetical protein